MDSNDRGDNGDKVDETGTGEKPKRQSAYRLAEGPEKPAGEEGSKAAESLEDNPQDRPTEAKGESGAPLIPAGIADGLKETFRRYIIEHVANPEQKEGSVNVNVDLNFIKEHGAPLLNTLVQSLTKAIVPAKLEIPLAKVAAPAAGEATQLEGGESRAAGDLTSSAEKTDEAEKRDVDVSVNFDLATFVKNLLQPKAVPPKDTQD